MLVHQTYVAYVFAGGESTASTARSVFFDGDDDRLTFAATSDFAFDTGDFTMECWARRAEDNDAYSRLLHFGPYYGSDNSVGICFDDGDYADKVTFMSYKNRSAGTVPSNARVLVSNSSVYTGQWYHIAVTRSSGVFRLFINGTIEATNSSITSNDLETSSTNTLAIGGTVDRMVSEPFDGDISNVRVVKGTALYTSSFRPPTEPLTNVTNTKLLCCNNSSTTGNTVTPGTITADGSPIAKTDSPFDDPAGFAFGDAEDQNVIKAGSWKGTGTAGLEVNIGFEPQWIMFKNASAAYNWYILDVMRGIVSDGDDTILSANTTSADFDSSYIDITSTGFKVQTSHVLANGSGSTYIFLALRRPDGYVGKPADAGTDVFNIANYDSTLPAFNANFPVDFAFFRRRTSTYDWRTSARLIQNKYLKTNTNGVETHENDYKFDYNDGWNAQAGYANTELSWMWKRHAGFDVVTYTGIEFAGRAIPHSLGVTPEMMWLKYRNPSGYNEDWAVYHKGLNGGVNPQDYAIRLDSDNPEYNNVNDWNDTAPTSTHFTIGSDGRNNRDGSNYIVMLFASVAGISKVGYYNGTGSSNHSITTGFQPRLIIIKPAHRADGYGGGWSEFDTVRGINSGNEYPMRLNYDSPENTLNHLDYIDLDSDGFTIQSSALSFNGSNARYIYYAHA
jgi:hypothetical protein